MTYNEEKESILIILENTLTPLFYGALKNQRVPMSPVFIVKMYFAPLLNKL
jgi:hypothetical protein